MRVLPTGKVQVVTGATPHGQGHETCWSMIVADKLGVDPDDVEVLHSDTAISPLGMDTYGSRSLAVGGVAIDMACDKVIDKARAIAAHQLEAAEDDLEFADGEFPVQGLARQGDAAGRRRLRGVHRPQPARRHGAEPRRPRSPTTRPTSRSRSAPTSAWSRSTRRPAASSCSTTSPSTTAATRSTRSSSRARSTAASSRASPRRCGRRRSTTTTATCVDLDPRRLPGPVGRRGAQLHARPARSRRARRTRSG